MTMRKLFRHALGMCCMLCSPLARDAAAQTQTMTPPAEHLSFDRPEAWA